MLSSTTRMTYILDLDNSNTFDVKISGRALDRVKYWKVLGVHLDEQLNWSVHIDKVVSSCYKTLGILKKMKRFAPLNVRKNLIEALIFSRIDYCNSLFYHAQHQYINRIQKFQNACGSFVLKKYCRIKDVVSLGLLPINKRIEFSILKLTHKALYLETYPTYLKLEFKSTNAYCVLRTNTK